ncbi:MAG: hypothetical protein Q8L78_00600 [Coxiellaceae bacterium]|nr:hypothetical protein [Coxiellaceae bacterium]
MHQFSRPDFALRWYDYCFMGLLFFCSTFLQQHQYFNWDGSWHLEGAKRLLQGATYSNGLFDDNLPMTFWFFVPAALLHQVFGINKILLANCSIEIALWASFFCARFFLKRIYCYAKTGEFYLIQYALLFFLLIYGPTLFGQRDFIATFLLLPYITLMGARAEERIVKFQNYFLRLLVGFFAAMAIAMNPFFLCIILVLEIQIFLAKRHKILSPELLFLSIFCVLYFLIMGIFYKEYYTVVIPSFYVFSPGYNAGFFELFFSYCSLMIFFGIALSFFWRKHCPRRAWFQVLLTATCISYFLYFLHRKLWVSHEIFSLCMVFLMTVIIFCDVIQSKRAWTKFFWITFLSFIFLIFSVISIIRIEVSNYHFFQNKKSSTRQLISIFNEVPAGSKLYFFSSEGYSIGIIMGYTKIENSTPWPNDWMLPAMQKNNSALRSLKGWKLAWANRYQQMFITQSISDLKNKKPNYVFIEMSSGALHVDFLNILSESPEFADVWKNYYLEKIIPDVDHGGCTATYFIYKRRE